MRDKGKEELRFFMRFLKDRGLYYAFVKDNRTSYTYFGKERLVAHMCGVYRFGITTSIIMDCLLWTHCSFKNWHDIYSEYLKYFKTFYNCPYL